MRSCAVAVIIPALNEEDTIGSVVEQFLSLSLEIATITSVLVVDNGSSDRTAEFAAAAGALVVCEKIRGYGSACWRGIEEITRQTIHPNIVVFADGDGSDAISSLLNLIKPIVAGDASLVIGSRVRGRPSKGSLSLPQRFGNCLATVLINLQYRSDFSDLGPFRAIVYEDLLAISMKDRAFGWTIEMQLKCLRYGLKVVEVPVPYYCRKGGKSKISGTIRGSYLAGTTILAELGKDWLCRKFGEEQLWVK
jgi:glycosyltransferase involved in cell wall biosynthesis